MKRQKIPAGFTLRLTLRAKEPINRFSWSPDGRMIASPSDDKNVRVWDAGAGILLRTLQGHKDYVFTTAWSPSGEKLATTSRDRTVRIWNPYTGALEKVIRGHSDIVYSAAWSPDGKLLATSSRDRTVIFWNTETYEQVKVLVGHSHLMFDVKWSPNGKILAALDSNAFWLASKTLKRVFYREFPGRSIYTHALAWTPDGAFCAVGYEAGISIFDMRTLEIAHVLETPRSSISCLSYSHDGSLLAARSRNGGLRLWRTDTWQRIAMLNTTASGFWTPGVAFHPHQLILATVSHKDTGISIWELDSKDLFKRRTTKACFYSNAKVVLVGDSGVGKSGLGLVLSGQKYEKTDSSHGRHIWIFDNSRINLSTGTHEMRETLLWDLAGQPGYRLLHQLHLNEVSVALVVFDARSETDPFAGVRHWVRALRQAERIRGDFTHPVKKYLIAARVDRGSIGVSKERLAAFLKEFNFDGFFETSAKEGWNIKDLQQSIRGAVDWDSLPKVKSETLFQQIKDFLLQEKTAGQILSTTHDLYRSFLKTKKGLRNSKTLIADFDVCIGRLESRDLVQRLSFGNLVLLQPELLDAYAASLIDAAKNEPDGMGCVEEDAARKGRFRIPKDVHIKDGEQEKLLLIAMVEDLLRHEIAFRESTDDGTHLVFPSQLTRERPDLPDPEGKSVIFSFEGPVLNIYATLVARLSHSGFFTKKEIWKNAVTFATKAPGTCGIVLREFDEGRGELTLFFDSTTGTESRMQFEDYVHTHLQRKALTETIQRRSVIGCTSCLTPLSDIQVTRRRERGFDWIECNVCGNRVSLLEQDKLSMTASIQAITKMDEAADARRELDTGLVSAVAEMQIKDFGRWAGASRTTLAIVFTDIVGSAALGSELGDEQMNRVRRSHFQRARSLIQKYNGYEIKTIGDAFMVAFHQALDALNFTLSLYDNTGHERIQIRAGIHVGPITIEEKDAFGSMVNFTARVQSHGRDAEIWVSSRAKDDIDLEKAKAHKALEWTKHPNCTLKGFPGKFILWSVLRPK